MPKQVGILLENPHQALLKDSRIPISRAEKQLFLTLILLTLNLQMCTETLVCVCVYKQLDGLMYTCVFLA